MDEEVEEGNQEKLGLLRSRYYTKSPRETLQRNWHFKTARYDILKLEPKGEGGKREGLVEEKRKIRK